MASILVTLPYSCQPYILKRRLGLALPPVGSRLIRATSGPAGQMDAYMWQSGMASSISSSFGGIFDVFESP